MNFFFSGIQIPRSTQNPLGSTVTPANVDQITGLNILGISLARIDCTKWPKSSPHSPSRHGNPFSPGSWPYSLPTELGHTGAVAIAGLSSQNPGVITIANAVFGANPPINPDVLAKAFQVDDKLVSYLQKQFWYDNN
ncbi:hypothetical protein ACFX2C_002542 [Malus domestica]